MRKRDERPHRILGRLDERRVTFDVADVGSDTDVTLTGERGGEVAGLLLRQVDRGDACPALRERACDRGADPAHRTGDDDAASVNPFAQ